MTNSITAVAGHPLAPAQTGREPWRLGGTPTSVRTVTAGIYPSTLRSMMRCMALILAALTLVAAYVVVPLAVAVESVVSAPVVAWGVSGAVLLEIFLLTAFIVLKTEGQGGRVPCHAVPWHRRKTLVRVHEQA
ncbi:hypothetical protein [Pseudarthrobacter enclensis]|uniref:Uncharacterized protein n=1 Tax=Pseudarthrobacter enclensis TaxID=993070 RepID=A0ABT9RQ63_9MICC|nr:hypothetical protein [Pseudarthrobacter enclensis]MDP9887374.1 hypothetical protein [Pseudarthrobacter enclensis]